MEEKTPTRPFSIFAWLRSFIGSTLQESIDEQRTCLESREEGIVRWRAFIVLCAAAIALTMRDSTYAPSFYGIVERSGANETLEPSAWQRQLIFLSQAENYNLARLAWWAIWQFWTYVLFPCLIIKLIFRERLRDYGLKLRGLAKGWWIYLGMYLFMAPLIVLVSTTESFQHTYPFFKPHNGIADSVYWSRFWIWQCFYAMQFISLEFFFRGFMIHGTRRHLGPYCILAMMIPYCMIHFGKPLPETCGAIIAGLVLGFMSLKTRSIWLGAAIHIGVAITMDLAAIRQW